MDIVKSVPLLRFISANARKLIKFQFVKTKLHYIYLAKLLVCDFCSAQSHLGAAECNFRLTVFSAQIHLKWRITILEFLQILPTLGTM